MALTYMVFRSYDWGCAPVTTKCHEYEDAVTALETLKQTNYRYAKDYYIVDCRKPALTQALDVMKQLYPNVGEPGHQTPRDLPEDKSLD